MNEIGEKVGQNSSSGFWLKKVMHAINTYSVYFAFKKFFRGQVYFQFTFTGR